MIVRIWRTGVDERRANEYREFAQRRSLPMFRAQPGFEGVLFTGRVGARAVITFWSDQLAVAELDTSDSYQETVAAIVASGFLRGESEVEILEIEDAWLGANLRGTDVQGDR
jgi:heme-degrading monooxygenase HmoA